jgi:NADH dehydrogenase
MIFLTGGSGFVGTNILRRLKELGHQTRCLVRSADDDPGDENIQGDILNRESLKGSMDGCDAVIHLVGIIDEHPSRGITFERIYVEGTRNVIDAAREAGIQTFVYMSANGARPDGVSAYQTGKWAAEEMARGAGFGSVTVFRPSIIFGPPVMGKREFASDLLDQLIKPFPVLPIFGDGQFEMQPVSIDSVAKAFVSAAVKPVAGNRDYFVSGPNPLPYVEIVDLITRASGRDPKPKINIPPSFVRLGIDLAGWTGLLPISRDQLDMLLEGNTCPHKPFHEDFGLEPVPFSIETLSYLRDRAR